MEVIIDGVKYAPIPDVPTDMSLLSALEARFDSDAGDNITVRDYLYELLTRLWDKGEGFSSKRPFGNSGWEYELYAPLIKNGYIKGTIDSEGYVSDFDQDEANDYVFDLISAAFYGVLILDQLDRTMGK